jgi:hypothetical protein
LVKAVVDKGFALAHNAQLFLGEGALGGCREGEREVRMEREFEGRVLTGIEDAVECASSTAGN